MRTILLKFAGPLQSWGTGSHFEKRHTDPYPSKSAVIGMIAACMGVRRGEDDRLHTLNRLHYAVRIDQPGHIVCDYHTVHKYKPGKELSELHKPDSLERTYVTKRYYLEDAVFVAAIGSDDTALMEEIETALKNPYFQPYLGRRSNPLTADSFLGAEDTGVLDALRTERWQAAPWYQRKNGAVLPIFADADLLPDGQAGDRRDLALSWSARERQYSFREEKRITVTIDPAEGNGHSRTEHDAFAALGDENVLITGED